MRISSAAALLLLAACAKGAGGQAAAAGGSGGGGAAKADDPVACALGGARDFAGACTLERGTQDGAPILVIRHPDGGFRRFVLRNGAIVTADGAQAAQVARQGATVEVAVGNDRYRLPASALGHAGP